MDLPAISFFKSALEMSAMLTVRTRRRTERRTRECETEEDNEKTSETAVTDSSTIKVKVPLSRALLII